MYIMLMFCLLLSACQSGKQKIINVKIKCPLSPLARAIKTTSLSCDFQFANKVSQEEWAVRLVFFHKGKLVNTDNKEYAQSFTSKRFGGFITVPSFSNVNIKLFFIDLEYINLNENIINKKHYKTFISVKSKGGGFSNTMFVPKSVMDLGGSEVGVFPENFKHPENIIPVFYLRDFQFWCEWEITEDSLPSPGSDLNSFITANHPNTLIICFLVKRGCKYNKFFNKFGIGDVIPNKLQEEKKLEDE
jgi:hypothetical protein